MGGITRQQLLSNLRCRGRIVGYVSTPIPRAARVVRDASCGWTGRRDLRARRRDGRVPVRVRRPCPRCGAGLEPIEDGRWVG